MFLYLPWLCVAAILLALCLDAFLGEPRRYHPLVGYGRWVDRVEAWLRPRVNLSDNLRLRGILALLLALLPLVLLGCVLHSWLCDRQLLWVLVAALLGYLCIGRQSLHQHALAICGPLESDDLPTARQQLARIVSRDTDALSAPDIAAASCESVLENGSDAIFAALFWFLVAGLPGLLLYRAANTLDAMWGYKNTRYRDFGWAAARLDDVLNWPPARLVALSYALMGQFTQAIDCWRQQAPQWKSPNAGPVMAAGAGSLGIRLGGVAQYQGEPQQRPVLGCGEAAQPADIRRALALVDRSLMLWLVVILMIAMGISAG